MKTPLSISVATVKCFVVASRQLGIEMDLKAIAEKYQLPFDFLLDDNNRLSLDILDDIAITNSEKYQEPLLGLKVASAIEIERLRGLKDILDIDCEVKDAIETFNRYFQIYSQMGHFTLERGPYNSRFVFHPSSFFTPSYHQIDCSLLVLYKYMRHLGGDGVLGLNLTYKNEQYQREYEEAFSIPVIFDMPENSFVIRNSWLSHKLEHFTKPSLQLIEKAERNFVSATGFSNIEDQVKFILKKTIANGPISGEVISGILGLSYRTFQRRLKIHNTTYKELLESSRKDLAVDYLVYDDLTVAEVARRLGYSDTSNFFRAFKSWTGMRPVEFRENYLSQQTLLSKSAYLQQPSV